MREANPSEYPCSHARNVYRTVDFQPTSLQGHDMYAPLMSLSLHAASSTAASQRNTSRPVTPRWPVSPTRRSLREPPLRASQAHHPRHRHRRRRRSPDLRRYGHERLGHPRPGRRQGAGRRPGDAVRLGPHVADQAGAGRRPRDRAADRSRRQGEAGRQGRRQGRRRHGPHPLRAHLRGPAGPRWRPGRPHVQDRQDRGRHQGEQGDHQGGLAHAQAHPGQGREAGRVRRQDPRLRAVHRGRRPQGDLGRLRHARPRLRDRRRRPPGRRHPEPAARHHRRSHRQEALRVPGHRERDRHGQDPLLRHRQPRHHPVGLDVPAHRRHPRRPQHLQPGAQDVRQGHAVHRRRQRVGHRRRLQLLDGPDGRRGRRLRRPGDLGLLQEHLRPQRHQEQRCRRLLPRPLRQLVRERVLGRQLLLHDVRRRLREQPPADRAGRGRPRDEPRCHLQHRGPQLQRRVRRPERGHLGHLRHRRGVLRQQLDRQGRLPHRREDRHQRRRQPAALHGQAQQGRRLGGLLVLLRRQPGRPLLVRRRQPLLLPAVRGQRREDGQRSVVQLPDLQRLHGHRHRPGQGAADLVQGADDVLHVDHQLQVGPHGHAVRGVRPVRLLQRRVQGGGGGLVGGQRQLTPARR
ncbi:hypothetical protein SGPA1_11664 [Streptomyces misionensis JCM 4497]